MEFRFGVLILKQCFVLGTHFSVLLFGSWIKEKYPWRNHGKIMEFHSWISLDTLR